MSIEERTKAILKVIIQKPKNSISEYVSDMETEDYKTLLTSILNNYGGSFAHSYLLKEIDFTLTLDLKQIEDIILEMPSNNSLGIYTIYEFYIFHTKTNPVLLKYFLDEKFSSEVKLIDRNKDLNKIVQRMYQNLGTPVDKTLLLNSIDLLDL